MKRFLCAAALIAVSAVAMLPTQAMAQVGVSITIGSSPPPMRYERVPPPRQGYLWAPGYWNWAGNRHVWAPGHWERARPGYAYSRPQWYHGSHGWELRRGGWHHGNPPRRDHHYGRRDDHRNDHRGNRHDNRGHDRNDHRGGR